MATLPPSLNCYQTADDANIGQQIEWKFEHWFAYHGRITGRLRTKGSNGCSRSVVQVQQIRWILRRWAKWVVSQASRLVLVLAAFTGSPMCSTLRIVLMMRPLLR